MCKLMDDLINDVVTDAVADAVADAVKDRDIETAKELIALGKLSLEDISKASKLPLSTVEELAASMKKDPA